MSFQEVQTNNLDCLTINGTPFTNRTTTVLEAIHDSAAPASALSPVLTWTFQRVGKEVTVTVGPWTTTHPSSVNSYLLLLNGTIPVGYRVPVGAGAQQFPSLLLPFPGPADTWGANRTLAFDYTNGNSLVIYSLTNSNPGF